jgi:glutamyl-Q tRNA(Asp) synthetase
MELPNYCGRFAPSPTGNLHFGSLVTAVASYLDAKHHCGTWLVRIEDIDTPRCVQGATDDILRTLNAFGLHSDEPILYQSQRIAAYEDALRKFQKLRVAYPCCCTRKEISDSRLQGIDGQIYPGTCRHGIPNGRDARAWRVRTDFDFSLLRPTHSKREIGQIQGSLVEFNDLLQGKIVQEIRQQIGDFVIKRADGLFAYQLAVVVDDGYQGITHVVRGCDLLMSTPRQIFLQRLLGLPTPQYLHLPVIVNKQGEKLSKQTLAQPVNIDNAPTTLVTILKLLRQQPPDEMQHHSISTILAWAIKHWHPSSLPRQTTLHISGSEN